MQFNTRLSTLFWRTREAFWNGFRETKSIRYWFKRTRIQSGPREDYLERNTYREDCPAAILHYKDIIAAMTKKAGILKNAIRFFALLFAFFIELPVLVVKNLIIDVITLPLRLVVGFIIDAAELVLNIISDIASLPAALFNALANKAPTFKKVEKNTNEEEDYAPAPSQQASNVLGQRNLEPSAYQQSADNDVKPDVAKGHSFVGRRV